MDGPIIVVDPNPVPRCIYRVPARLRRLDTRNLYTPSTVSIGPFHHGITACAAMELRKRDLLARFVRQGTRNMTEEDIIAEIARRATEVKNCYSGPVGQTDDEFSRMLLVDGAFILQLLRATPGGPDAIAELDLDQGQVLEITELGLDQEQVLDIKNDLMLLENQLPYFFLRFLNELVGFINGSVQDENDLNHHIYRFWEGYQCNTERVKPFHEHKHFVDLLYAFQVPDTLSMPIEYENEHTTERTGVSPNSFKGIITAKNLQKAGVTFEPPENNYRRVSFGYYQSSSRLDISTLEINSASRTLYGNLIAFEQCHEVQYKHYLSDYLMLVDMLISESEEVLQREGILVQDLGGGETAANVLSDICNNIQYSSHIFNYEHLCQRMVAFCNRPSLKAKTLYSAASLLLVFTVIQTVCTALIMWKTAF